MSARFAELMALSAAQTQDSDAATKQILEEKRRKEEQRRKEQMDKEKRDREFRAKLVKKRLEEQQHAGERQRKQEEERQRREDFIRQREEEQRKNLIYGKNRLPSGSGTGGRGRKTHNGSDDDEEVGGLVLTREEKRQRKLLSDLNKSFTSARRGHASPVPPRNFKKSSRLGPVADVLDPSASRSMEPRHPQEGSAGSNFDSGKSIQAVRKQLAAMPTTFVKLGTTKRDNRTIDEIATELHKKKEAKVINGEEARRNGFDWFGEQKKGKKVTPMSSLSPSPEARASHSPRSRSKEPTNPAKPSTAPQPRKEPRTKVTIIKPEPVGSVSFTKTTYVPLPSRPTVASKPATLHASQSTSATAKLASSSNKKRARSDSLSDSDESMSDEEFPPPVKRRPRNDISSEIWKLFGKDRDRYVANDVFSDDDDDMEADAEALRKEELRSARIAKREDELAAEQEKRHEEEKRRKKKEKDRRGY